MTRSVSGQAGRHEVGCRVVVALHGQRAQLDRQEHRDVVRVPDEVVVQPRHAGRAGNAAQPENGDALDVGTQA
jgi:hypothetical protein